MVIRVSFDFIFNFDFVPTHWEHMGKSMNVNEGEFISEMNNESIKAKKCISNSMRDTHACPVVESFKCSGLYVHLQKVP